MIDQTKLSPDELAVYRIISERKVTQNDIARDLRFLGCHEIHEINAVPKNHNQETTLRKIRQIIRNLLLNHSAPILSDTDGYWIGNSVEAKEVLERMERTAISQSRAWFETYRALKDTFDVSSDFFEQGKLF